LIFTNYLYIKSILDDVDAIYADYYDGTEGQYENDQIATTSTFSKILFAALILFFIVAFLYHAINLNHSAPDIPTSGQ
jgi:ferric iron reductase protein FhuF